jgi:hypothetical protein
LPAIKNLLKESRAGVQRRRVWFNGRMWPSQG